MIIGKTYRFCGGSFAAVGCDTEDGRNRVSAMLCIWRIELFWSVIEPSEGELQVKIARR